MYSAAEWQALVAKPECDTGPQLMVVLAAPCISNCGELAAKPGALLN